MRRERQAIAAVAVVVAMLTLAPGAARGAVTIGATPVPDALNCISTDSEPVIYAQTGSIPPPGPQYAAPSAGVITSWSFRSGDLVPAYMRFKVIRNTAPPIRTVVGQSWPELILPGQLNTFATDIPVEAGDVIGFVVPGAQDFACGVVAPAFATASTEGDPQPGVTVEMFDEPGARFSLSAQLEPDIDKDGFGDETQDLCPSDADTQGPCRDEAAPETMITNKPKRRTTRRKATFQFSSTEPGVTFKCSLDGQPFAECASPERFKLKRGRHAFTVFAKDAAGNVDDSPSTASWTVRKKR